ncbi:MAG: C40 family peptidase [Nocardioidaceae bacterium]
MPANAALRRALIVFPILLVTVVSLLALSPQTADAGYLLRSHKIHHSVRVAKNHVGDPYVYGADGPRSFDCSGLTKFSYNRAGLYMPRSAGAQYRYVRHIHKRNLRRGDFVFFHNASGYVYHVGVYLGRIHGHRVILHAPYPGKRVSRARIWTRSWYAGTLRFRP